MGTNVVPGYNPVLLVGEEAVLGTYVAPANVAAYAAQAVATITADLGPAQEPAVRAKQDRGLGRGMQDGWVSGRFAPVPWNVMTSMKSRALIADPPRELSLFKACGLARTINVGTSYVLSPSATPVESLDYVPINLTRILGRSPGEMEIERLSGCLVDTLKIEGGDKEVMLGFSGVGQSKVQGTNIASITVLIGATTITCTAAESYAYAAGYYICEAEVILVGPVTYGGTTINITRGQLGTAAAAHTAQPIYPHLPAGVVYAGTPISEALTTTCTFAGNAFRVLKWALTIKTGLAPLPGETGSAYFQGVKATRYDVSLAMDFILKGDDVRLFNRAISRAATALSLVQGTAVGGILTATLPTCELVAPAAKDNGNDSITVSATVRVRDDVAGNNAFNLALS